MSRLSEFSRILAGTFIRKMYLAETKSTCGGMAPTPSIPELKIKTFGVGVEDDKDTKLHLIDV